MKNEQIQIDEQIVRKMLETMAKILSEKYGVKITVADIKRKEE